MYVASSTYFSILPSFPVNNCSAVTLSGPDYARGSHVKANEMFHTKNHISSPFNLTTSLFPKAD